MALPIIQLKPKFCTITKRFIYAAPKNRNTVRSAQLVVQNTLPVIYKTPLSSLSSHVRKSSTWSLKSLKNTVTYIAATTGTLTLFILDAECSSNQPLPALDLEPDAENNLGFQRGGGSSEFATSPENIMNSNSVQLYANLTRSGIVDAIAKHKNQIELIKHSPKIVYHPQVIVNPQLDVSTLNPITNQYLFMTRDLGQVSEEYANLYRTCAVMDSKAIVDELRKVQNQIESDLYKPILESYALFEQEKACLDMSNWVSSIKQDPIVNEVITQAQSGNVLPMKKFLIDYLQKVNAMQNILKIANENHSMVEALIAFYPGQSLDSNVLWARTVNFDRELSKCIGQQVLHRILYDDICCAIDFIPLHSTLINNESGYRLYGREMLDDIDFPLDDTSVCLTRFKPLTQNWLYLKYAVPFSVHDSDYYLFWSQGETVPCEWKPRTMELLGPVIGNRQMVDDAPGFKQCSEDDLESYEVPLQQEVRSHFSNGPYPPWFPINVIEELREPAPDIINVIYDAIEE